MRKSVRPLTVLQPELQISASGPNMTFVNRDGIYAIQIDNTGQVDVTDVQLDFQVPAGFEVTTVSREAQLDTETGSLLWFYERIVGQLTRDDPAEGHDENARHPGVHAGDSQQ